MVDTVLAQIERKIDSLEVVTPKSLNETVESIVKQEMALKRERDANLQFKLDRLKHKFDRLEQKTSLAIKIQLICNVILLSAVLLLSYLVFIN